MKERLLSPNLQALARSLKLHIKLLAQDESAATSHPENNRVRIALQAIDEYERLASETYKLRGSRHALARERSEAEDTLADISHDLIALSVPDRQEHSAYRLFVREYREIWRRNFGLFVFTSCIFIATALLGWNIGVNQPDYMYLFVDQGMLEQIQDGNRWFDRLQSNPLMGGFRIAVNNIKVAISTFVFGALFGFGGIWTLGANGLMLGAVLGYCWSHSFDDELISFILSHGPLEISLIVASCFTGLIIGRVFYQRPRALFAARMRVAGREASVLALGVIPWLVIASILEVGISPWPTISVGSKVMFGVASTLAFWMWTCWPDSRSQG